MGKTSATVDLLSGRVKDLERELTQCRGEVVELQHAFNAAIPLCIIDKHYTIIRVNESFCTYFNCRREELLGRKCSNVLKNKVCLQSSCPLVAVMNGASCSSCELEWERPDGTRAFCLVTATPYRSADGELWGIVENLIDITAHKQADISLRESDERLRTILQNMPAMMAAFDEDGKIVMWNNECERMTGFTAAEIIGNAAAMHLLYPDEAYRKLVIEKLALPVKDYYNWEFDIFSKDRKARTIAWSNISKSFPVPGCSSWVVGVDITERTLHERTLRDRERQLVIQAKKLNELNTALEIMLGKKEDNKKEVEENILNNIRRLMLPVLEKLSTSNLDHRQRDLINVLESNMRNVISPFSKKLTTIHAVLSPTEIQVANYIKEGKTTKEIAVLMHVSKRTIDAHRANIRKKVKITKNSNKVTLKSYLLNLQ